MLGLICLCLEVRRDVVSTGVAGDNVTIRFTTDNPGPWFLHWWVCRYHFWKFYLTSISIQSYQLASGTVRTVSLIADGSLNLFYSSGLAIVLAEAPNSTVGQSASGELFVHRLLGIFLSEMLCSCLGQSLSYIQCLQVVHKQSLKQSANYPRAYNGSTTSRLDTLNKWNAAICTKVHKAAMSVWTYVFDPAPIKHTDHLRAFNDSTSLSIKNVMLWVLGRQCSWPYVVKF